MKKILLSVIASLLVAPLIASAQSSLEGSYRDSESAKQVRFIQFNRSLTMNTSSRYSTGEEVNWFFEFILPAGRDVQVGESITGRVRSLDSYYNCVFDEKAYLQKDASGNLKLHHPLLTYHRETRSVREEGNHGYRYGRQVDWNGWGWVETGYFFPIERWRVIASTCVIDQRNWTTGVLLPVGGRPVPVPSVK